MGETKTATVSDETLKWVRDRILEACGRERVERIMLFGSHARGDARPESDLDVLVLFRTEEDQEQCKKVSFPAETPEPQSVRLQYVRLARSQFEQKLLCGDLWAHRVLRERRTLFRHQGVPFIPTPSWQMLERARGEISYARIIMEKIGGDSCQEACGQCYTAAERIVSAILLRKGKEPPYRTDLAHLARLIPDWLPVPEAVRKAATALNVHTALARGRSDETVCCKAAAEEALRHAEALCEWAYEVVTDRWETHPL